VPIFRERAMRYVLSLMSGRQVVPYPHKFIYKSKKDDEVSLSPVKIVAQWPKRSMIFVLPGGINPYMCAENPNAKIPTITILTCRIPHQI
jgi:hypothetical protein